MEIILDNRKVACPLSGGINSAAVLCWLIESGMKPKELHLFYAHFVEHSPGTLEFVQQQMEYAKSKLDNVFTEISQNSVLEFFRGENMIPHPIASPCSKKLKIEPLLLYNSMHNIEIDLIGYVRKEKSRMDKNQGKNDLFMETGFPLKNMDDEWCFDIVKKHLGGYPAIYDLRWNDAGFIQFVKDNLHRFNEDTQFRLLRKIKTNKRVFKHNNCLPCKNMNIDDMLAVEYFYPEYMAKAKELSNDLNAYWGRNKDEYYTTFGKEDYEAPQCETCNFD